MRGSVCAAASTLAVLFVAGLAARGEEKKIARAELPPAVEKIVAEQAKGATIRGFSTETEHGKTLYEAALTVNGHGRDISIDENGTIVEVEQEVDLDTLPTAVKEGLRTAAGSGQIVKVESVSKLGKLVAYEAVVKRASKRTEIQVNPAGRKLPKQ